MLLKVVFMPLNVSFKVTSYFTFEPVLNTNLSRSKLSNMFWCSAKYWKGVEEVFQLSNLCLKQGPQVKFDGTI